MFTIRVLAAAVVVSAAAAPLAAQESASGRAGFGMSIGLGSGSAGLTCDDCVDVDRISGISGYLRLGAYVNPRFFIGIEGTGWIKNDEGVERRIAAGSVVFVGYPSESAGLFVRSGAGYLRTVIDSELLLVVGEGITWQIGAGWDISMGTGAALTPYVTYVQSTEVAADLNGVPTGYNVNPNILQFGLAITVH